MRSITTLPTWNASPLGSIEQSITLLFKENGGGPGTSEASVRAIAKRADNVVPGMRRRSRPVATFASGRAISDSSMASPWEQNQESAQSVEMPLRLTPVSMQPCVARPVAHADTVGMTYKRFPAQDAGRSLGQSERDRSIASPPVVKRLRESGTLPVFNLQVADQPEFFANGVLVHNCNLLQFFYVDHSIQARELTPQERAEEALLPHQRQDSIDSETDPERREKNVMSREVALRKQAHEGLVKQFTNGRTGRGFTAFKKLAGKMK